MIYNRKTVPQFDQVVMQNIKILCHVKGIDPRPYIVAYKYFSNNPDRYDGATIVKDLVDCNGIDLSALRHDFEYIRILPTKFCIFKWLKYKLQSDFNYGKSMEKLGKGVFTPYTRVALLWLSTPLYPLWKMIKYHQHQKTNEPAHTKSGKQSTKPTASERK